MWNRKGFTLIEVLTAVAITSFGLVVIMRLLPEGIASSRRVERWTRDTLLAQSKMDEVRSQILGTDPDYGFSKPGGYDESGNFTDDPDYYYTVNDDMGSDIKELSVIVWFDENGDGDLDEEEQNVRLDTKIADRG